jgi:tetratricopeptide (TPR) repeat protein
MSRKRVLVAVAMVAWLVPAGVFAVSPSQQVPVGPRPIAMGGAYTSLADDISAIYWNPAGLCRIGHQEITGTYANLYDSDIKDSYAAFVLPLAEHHALAVDWYHSGFDDGELGFGENRFDLSYGFRLHRMASVGLNLKYLTRNTSLDGSTVRQGSGSGLDLGILIMPRAGLRFGVIGQDLFDTKLEYDEGGTAVAFPRNVRVGASCEPHRAVTLALDVDDRYHLGTEVRPLDLLSLRAGLEKDRDGGEDEPTYAVGAGFEVGIFRLDYAYAIPPVLSATHHMGLSLAFNFNPSQIRIEKVEVENLHASLYKRYATTPVGKVRLRNLQDRPLETKISTFVPGSMDAPTEQQVMLRPKATLEVPIQVVLSDEVMSRANDRPIQVQVAATYQSQRLSRTEKKSARTVLYGPGAVDWSRGVAQAAAFVTAKDPAVDALARDAVRASLASEEAFFGNRNLRSAAAIFDALGAMGITYVPDPENPYSSVSETARAVDTVHYPRETLQGRTGDCDDTTVLYAALLANVGVATQLVDVPGHVFLLVDAGIHERNRIALGLDESFYVVADDGVWVPIETTAIAKGFAEAWRSGAEQYRSWAARDRLERVDVETAQAEFPPSELPAAPGPTVSADAGELRARLASDGLIIGAWRDGYMAARFGGVREDLRASAEALNEIAQIYYIAGRFDEAIAKLEEILRGNSGSATAINNLGNIHAVRGEMDQAVARYRVAAEVDPTDGGPWLNLGLVHYVSGDSLGGRAEIARGLERSGGFDPACRLLGLAARVAPGRAGETKLTEEEVRMLLAGVASEVPMPGVVDTLQTQGGSQTPPVPPQAMATRVAASRAALRMEIRDYLYWKNEEGGR